MPPSVRRKHARSMINNVDFVPAIRKKTDSSLSVSHVLRDMVGYLSFRMTTV